MQHFFNQRRPEILLVLVLIVAGSLSLFIVADPAQALGVAGKVSTVSYLHEPGSSLQDPDPGTAMEQLGRLSFTIQDPNKPAWSLYYTGTMRGELLNDGLSSMKNRVYRGYLQYKPTGRLQVQVGRVWSNGGVASGLVDGARIRWRTTPGTLIVAGGTRGFSDPTGTTTHTWDKSGWSESGQAGVFFRSRTLGRKLNLGGSWSRAIWQGVEESEKVGALISYRPAPGWTVLYENNYELNQEVFFRHHLRGHHRFNNGGAALSWTRREGYEPAYASSYIFRKFRFEPWFETAVGGEVQEVRAHVMLQPAGWNGWRISADLVEIFPTGQDRGDGLDLWAGCDLLRVGYRGMRGYRGEQDGFYGNLSHWVRPDTRLWLDLNRISYAQTYEALAVDGPERRKTIATRLGADYRVGTDWFFSGSLERVQFPGIKSDYRAMLKISYHFNLGARGQEVW